MIKTRTRRGIEYKYNTETGLYENPVTGQWVRNPRKSSKWQHKGKAVGKAKGKAIKKVKTNRRYYIWEDVQSQIQHLFSTPHQQERCNLVASKLYDQLNLMRFKSDDENDPYAYFYSDEWKYIAGNQNAKKYYLDAYQKLGFILPVQLGVSIYAQPIMGYQLSDVFYNGKKQWCYIETALCNESMNKYYLFKEQGLSHLQRQVFHVNKHAEFRLDKETFQKEIVKKHPKYMDKFNLKTKHVQKYKNKQDERIPRNLIEYTNIQNYHWDRIEAWNGADPDDRIEYFTSDKFGKRLYSLFSAIPSELRKYIYLNDKQIDICIDLKNSQFTLAANYVMRTIGKCRFTDIVESGFFYEFMASELGIKGKHSRDIAKIVCLNMLYGNVYGAPHLEFERIFPKAGKLFRQIKSEWRVASDYGCKRKIKMNANLAMDLQRAESKMFQSIWRVLHDQKDLFIPVHDAIYTNSENAEKIYKDINIIMKDRLDIEHKLDMEDIKSKSDDNILNENNNSVIYI